MCVHRESEVHLLRREDSPPPESSNVSGRFGNTCALLSLCLSLTLTADTEGKINQTKLQISGMQCWETIHVVGADS